MSNKYFLRCWITTILIALYFCASAYSQMPKITEDIIAKSQDMLTHEDAVVLSTVTEINLKSDWKYEYKISRRVKLFSTKAYQKYGEISIPYLKDMQNVLELKGHTVTPDGERLKAKKIHDYMPQSEMPIYGGNAIKILSMPGLEKGSIIEYSYKIKSKDLGTLGLFNDFTMLTEEIPVEYAKYSVTLPSNIPLYYFSNGIPKEPVIMEKNKKKEYVWEASGIEYIRIEENFPPIKSISSWIAVSTFNSWDEYIDVWRKIYETRAAVNPKIKKVVEELVAGIDDKYDKAKAIFQYVQNEIRYLGIEFGRAGWVPFSASKVFSDKAGDCKGKTVLLMSMMKAADIDAYPVLISIRSLGPIIKDFCSDTQFTHVLPVCEIDNNFIWMDPTGKSKFGTLPYYYQGVDALVIKKGKRGFFTTPVSEATDNKTEFATKIDVANDGSATGTLTMESIGFKGLTYRSIMELLNPETRDIFFQTTLNTWIPGARVSDYSYSDYLNSDIPISINFEFLCSNFAEKTGDMMIINLGMKHLMGEQLTKQNRYYDMVLPVKILSEQKDEINIPEGYVLNILPDAYSKKTPFFEAYIEYCANGKNIIREIHYESLLSTIPKEEYPSYKESLDEFFFKAGSKIVLKKQ